MCREVCQQSFEVYSLFSSCVFVCVCARFLNERLIHTAPPNLLFFSSEWVRKNGVRSWKPFERHSGSVVKENVTGESRAGVEKKLCIVTGEWCCSEDRCEAESSDASRDVTGINAGENTIVRFTLGEGRKMQRTDK